MAVVQFHSLVDLNSDVEWDWEVTSLSPTQIGIAGPVFSATFQGAFVIGQNGVTGTLHSASQFKHGVLQFSVSGMSLDAATVAYLVDQATAEATYSFILQGDDTQIGSSANDLLGGFGGNDSLDGGLGTDVAYYSGARANYTVARNPAGGFTVTDSHGGEGVDTLVSVERLQFADQWMALDIDGNAGKAYRIYEAAFNRLPDLPGLGWWINSLDVGVSLHQIAAFFITSKEFVDTYGALDNSQFVTALYQNVHGRAPDQGGFDYWLPLLNNQVLNRADVLQLFSESPENQANVIGLIENGVVFTI